MTKTASDTISASLFRRCRPFILILLFLPLVSCQRFQIRDDLARNQSFIEIVKREDSRWIGDDKFFEKNLLANPYPEARQWTAIALGRIGSPQALPLLYQALHSGDAPVRAASAFAIGEIQDREMLQKQFLEPDSKAAAELLLLLEDPSLAVRTRAVEALGKAGSHAEAAEIVRRLESFNCCGDLSERIYLESAITALARLQDPVALPFLEKLAGMNDSEIQWRALDALIRLHSKAAAPLFIKNLDNPNPEVRSCAARGMGIIEDPQLASLLLPLLPPNRGTAMNPIPLSVRLSALQALGELNNPAVIPSIKTVLEAEPIDDTHPDRQAFAAQAAEAIGRMGASDGESALLPLLKIPGPVANHAVIALAKILKENPQRFFSLTDPKQFSGSMATQAWAQALGEMKGPDAIRELDRMMRQAIEGDSASETLPSILTALVKSEAPDLQKTLEPFFRLQDAGILNSAIAAYQPAAAIKEPWTPILQAFTASAADHNIEARIAILSHLQPWARTAKVQEALRSCLTDPNQDIQMACTALLRSASASSLPPDRPADRNTTDAFCQVLGANRKNSTIARLETTQGIIEIELFRENAPVTVANFVMLATGGAYNGMELSGAIPLQRIEGKVHPSQKRFVRPIKNEVNLRPFKRGSIGMALTGNSSDTGHFFISLAPQPYLDGISTCFGQVVSGIQAADRMIMGGRIHRITIKETISPLNYRRYY